jgi:hypothetical protein
VEKKSHFFDEGMARNCHIGASHRDAVHLWEESNLSIIDDFFADLFALIGGHSFLY